MSFREMRRKKQVLSKEECIKILNENTSGVLAVDGDDGYPYSVPISYTYENSKLYFHCALSGHKIDAIARNNKVSFCVIEKDDVVSKEYTTYFKSVILFGIAKIITNDEEKVNILNLIVDKYSKENKENASKEINQSLKNVCIVEVDIQHMSGKQSIELL